MGLLSAWFIANDISEPIKTNAFIVSLAVPDFLVGLHAISDLHDDVILLLRPESFRYCFLVQIRGFIKYEK